MWVVLGLGNSGEKYRQTRHNVGFVVLRELVERQGITWTDWRRPGIRLWRGQAVAQVASFEIEGNKVMWVIPYTLMNITGQNLLPFLQYFRVEPRQLIVVHDDLDMSPGSVKRRAGGGGDGGHKGVRSLAGVMKSKDFWRIKVGIGRNEHIEVPRWVLTPFARAELDDVHGGVSDEVMERIQEIINGGLRD